MNTVPYKPDRDMCRLDGGNASETLTYLKTMWVIRWISRLESDLDCATGKAGLTHCSVDSKSRGSIMIAKRSR